MIKNHKISVIVPVFNTEKFLSKCLDSILNQSYKNLEIIIVNDGSTDKSKDICLKYAETDNRVIFIDKDNSGIGSARNTGIEVATGEFLSFVDSDDYIHPQFIKKLYHGCIQNNVNISMCSRFVVTGDLVNTMFTAEAQLRWSGKEAVQRLLKWDLIDGSAWDKLYSRSAFGNRRFPVNRLAEDLPVVVSVLCEQDYIVHVGEPLYYYIQREGSITRQSFSLNKISVLDSAREVRAMVQKKYPDLTEDARHYYYNHLLYIVKLTLSERKIRRYKNDLAGIRMETRSNLSHFLFNDRIASKDKIILILFVMNLLQFVASLKRFITGNQKNQIPII
jgi:glycosyltransferase involved in cell wall biosynthesis